MYNKISYLITTLFLVNPVVLFCLGTNLFFIFLIFFFNFILIFFINKKLKLLIFYLNFLIFILTSAEIIFRDGFKNFNINNLYESKKNYYFNKKNLKLILESEEYQSTYITNDYGYRTKNIFSKKKNFKKDVWLFIGDSYTQGAQVNFNELYTSLIQDKKKNVEIINAGISGYNIIDEYHYLKEEGFHLNPKKIFIQISVLNDFSNIESREKNLSDILFDKSELYRYLFLEKIYPKFNNNIIKRWVDPFQPNLQMNKDFNILYKKTSNLKILNLLKLQKYLIKIKHIADKLKSEVYLIVIPTKEQVYKKYLKEVLTKYKIDSNYIDLYKSSKISKKYCEKSKIKLLDPLQIFINSNKPDLYYDFDEHINNNGHKLLSNFIINKLKI